MTRFLGWILFLLFSFQAYAQEKGDYIWIGGTQPYPDETRADGHLTDFNRQDPKPRRQDIRYGFTGNNASVSDKEGRLLFYFNGCAVMNRHHQIMPNGDSINAGRWFDVFWQGNCMYGYPGAQNCIILNDPANEYGYYLIHTTIIYYPQVADSAQLNYSYIDMSLDDGKGAVLWKNTEMYDKHDFIFSYTTAIADRDQGGWWLLQPKIGSQYLTFHIGKEGIERYPDQESFQYFDKDRSSAGGTARFSPDGTRFALYNYNDQLHIYDFDRATGLLSNHQKIEIYHPDSIDRELLLFSSVEWSPNSRFVYCASYLKLHQVDTWESNIQDGVKHIADYNGTLDPFPTELFLMVLGPDCRIYMTPKNGSYSLHVINKPDEPGTECDFVQNAIRLPNSNSGTLPNFPRFRVDEAEKCDPTITSVFGQEVYYRRELTVYPNPSHGVFTVKIPEGTGRATLSVTGTNGAVILERQLNTSSPVEEVDITPLPAGHYNIHIYPEINNERIFFGKQVIKL